MMIHTLKIVVTLALLILSGCNSGMAKSGTSGALQHDLDIARLKDVATLAGLIEEYKEIKGKYPFEGDVAVPHYVHIATEQQQKYAKAGPPYDHKKTSALDFIKELQSALGTNIEIPFDLQKVPTNKPNFYIYLIKESTYFIAVHTHQDYAFANKVAAYYNKVEITNNKDAVRRGIWLRDELLKNQEYINAINALPNKPGYTEGLREKLGGNKAF